MCSRYAIVEGGHRTGMTIRLPDSPSDEQIFAALQGIRWRRFNPALEVLDLLDRCGFELVDAKGDPVAELLLDAT
jgi:hypothetical protein